MEGSDDEGVDKKRENEVHDMFVDEFFDELSGALSGLVGFGSSFCEAGHYGVYQEHDNNLHGGQKFDRIDFFEFV